MRKTTYFWWVALTFSYAVGVLLGGVGVLDWWAGLSSLGLVAAGGGVLVQYRERRERRRRQWAQEIASWSRRGAA